MVHPMEGIEQQRQQQREEARQAAEKAEAEARRALMPQNEKDEIVFKHAQAAQEELDRRAQLTAEQRETETLSAELNSLTTTMREHYKQPTRYTAELKAEEARMDEITKRLQQLGAVKDPSDPRRSRGATLLNGQLFDGSGKLVG